MNLEPNSQRSEKERDSTRPFKVWAQLTEMFGNAFLRENDDEPPDCWIAAIDMLADAQISTGLANLGNDELTFPPNLSQFNGACKRQNPVRRLGVKCLPMSDDEKVKNDEKAWRDMEKLAGRSLR